MRVLQNMEPLRCSMIRDNGEFASWQVMPESSGEINKCRKFGACGRGISTSDRGGGVGDPPYIRKGYSSRDTRRAPGHVLR